MPSSRPASKGKLLKGLQDRENFLQQIADLTPDLLFVIDLKSQEILYINNRAEKILGYNASYVYDKGPEIFKSLLHPDDLEECLANLKACRKLVEDDETVFDVRLRSANGNWNWFRLKNKVFKQEKDGAVSQTIVIAENIQEQKIADEKLKEEHRRFKNAQAIGHIGSFERDLHGENLICSEEFYRIHGLEPRAEGITSQQFLSFVHPDDQEALLSAINHTHATGEPLNEINRIIRPDGNVRHVHRRAEIIQNTQGIPIRVYGTIQDITEHVEAQKKIQYSESLMRQAEVVGQFGSYEFDLRSGQLWLSDGFYSLFGYEPKGFEPGLEFIDAVSNPEDAQSVQKILEQAAQDKQPYEYFRRIYDRNGQMRYLRSNGKVICDAAGNAIKLLGIVEDITDRRQAEENLKEEHRRLKEAQAIGHIGSFEWLKGEDHFYWSEENFRIHGLEPQSIPMTLARFSGLIHPEDVPKVKALILKCWKKAVQGDFVYRLIKPDGELGYVHGRFESFANEAGKITHINGTVQDITEQVKAELELKESKAFAEQITSTTPDLIIITDVAVSNRVIYTNHNYFWKADFDEDTFYQMQDAERVEAIVHPDDLEKALAFLRERRLLADGEVNEVDLRISEKNAWVRIRSKVFKRDKSGFASQIICFVSDITERKKAEQSLKEAYSELERSNTTVSRMLEGSLAAIVLLNPLRDEKGTVIDFIFKGANKAAETINQKTEAELLGRRMFEIFPAGRNIFFDAFLEVMETGETIRMERQYKTESLDLWVDLSATRNGDGIILTFTDITDRKKAEEQLEESALFIRKIADTTPDILFVFDQEMMRLQYTNKNLKPLLGKNLEPPQAPDLKELLSLVHPKDKEDAITYMRNIAEANDEKVKEVAFRIQNQQGDWRWFHCRGRVFKRSREGRILQHLFIMRDITEEKNTTKALLEAEQLSVKGTMARTIAHEVRVPAANISLSMEMIQQELEDKLTENEEAMIYFNIVTKSCRRISHFINDLISISITEPEAFTETDLGILAEDVINEAQDRIFLKGVQVERHFSKGYFISADRERLKIAILNIVINAIEAMEDQKGLLQVFIGHEDDKAQITIKDNGSGMTKEQLSRMFDVYYTSKPNGMGVGLANVKAILKDHSAKVKVNSKPGKGTAFIVIFPKLR